MSTLLERVKDFFASLGPTGLYPLVILCAFAWIDEFDQVAFGALSPEIRHFFHLSEASFILIVSLSGALSILVSAPLGYLADRHNRVRISQIAALVWGVAALGTGLAPVLGHLGVLDERGRPAEGAYPGLYFAGYSNPLSGNLRELGIHAREIADRITSRRRSVVADPRHALGSSHPSSAAR